ncbi:MAG: hypothetical protein AAF092_12070 [Pseudomonadota bacterium]
MGPMWLVRAARMARNPPSKKMVLIVLTVVGCAAVIVGGERLLGLELERPGVNLRSGPEIRLAE